MSGVLTVWDRRVCFSQSCLWPLQSECLESVECTMCLCVSANKVCLEVDLLDVVVTSSHQYEPLAIIPTTGMISFL